MRRIGLLGGSFDPPHLGHLLLSVAALEAAALDAVWWLPVVDHAHRKPLRPFDQRLRLCQAAVARHSALRVEPIEAQLPTPSYSLRTVEALQAREPDAAFDFLIGADLVPQLPTWHRWDTLRQRVRFLAFGRGGHPEPEGADVIAFPIQLPEVSSSALRAELAAGGDGAPWLPQGVAAILRREPALYGP